MNTNSTNGRPVKADQPDEHKRDTPSQRDALAQSERKAAKDRPADYQEENAEDKIVSTQRKTQHEAGSITGIDNDRADSTTP